MATISLVLTCASLSSSLSLLTSSSSSFSYFSGKLSGLGGKSKKSRNKSTMSKKTCTISNSNNNNQTTFIFVYGTLKQGFPNYDFIKNDTVYLGLYTTHSSFPLVCGPYNIPFLINLPGSGHRITGELYDVSVHALAKLDDLEGVANGHYERLPITVCGAGDDEGDVEAEAYFAHRSYGEVMWRKCEEKGLASYTVEEGRMYVRRKDRLDGKSFLEAVQAFCRVKLDPLVTT